MNAKWMAMAAVMVSVGCSSGEENLNREAVYEVKGKVTLNGAPVAGADVSFHSTTSDRSAFGRTNDDGTFALTTYKALDGAIAGKHEVVILQLPDTPPTPEYDIDDPNYAPPEFAEAEGAANPPPKSLLPLKYSERSTSGLTAEVTPDGENEFTFELRP